MKSTDMSYIGDQSCSCTSCMYRSEADHPSLRNIISQGSRIDRLYYGKYIPLRERKLLEKLVRTRGVYDDIRTQLLSNSSICLDTKTVFKPRRKASAKKIKNRQHSNEIIELVDLVDKGEKLESKELSGCCSYCTCSSKYNIHSKPTDKERLRRAYPGALRRNYVKEKMGEYKKRAVRFKTKHIKSDPCTCTYKFSGMLKHLSQMTAKRMRYPPVQFADLMPTYDEELNPHKNSYLTILSNENFQQSNTYLKDLMTEGMRKLSESKLKIQDKINLYENKSLEKLSKLKNNIKPRLKIQKPAKRDSVAICKCPERNLFTQIKKDSISKFKDDLRRKKNLRYWECSPECIEDTCIPEKCYIKLIQKRSRRKHNRSYKVNRGVQDQIIRESLIKPIIKVHSKEVAARMPIKFTKQRTHEDPNPWVDINSDKNKVNEKLQNDIKQLQQTKYNKILIEKSAAHEPGFTVTNKRAKNLNTGRLPENASRKQVVRIGSSFTFNIEFNKNRADPNTNLSQINLKKMPDITKQSQMRNNYKDITKSKMVRRRELGSKLKLKTKTKNTKSGDDNSKRRIQFGRHKLKTKRRKPKSTNESTTTRESVLKFSTAVDRCTSVDCDKKNTCKAKYLKQFNNEEAKTGHTYQSRINLRKKIQKRFQKNQKLLPYECEPNVCIPDNCDPYRCIQLINTRNTNRKNFLVDVSPTGRTKSTSSLTSMSYPPLKPKFVKSMTSYKSGNSKIRLNKIKKTRRGNIKKINHNQNGRQVVRIGSNFSFNIEFYKTPHPFSTPNINILPNRSDTKSHKITGNQKVLENKSITPINNNLNKKTGIGTTLKRCFCTLKIQETKKNKRNKMVTMGTNVINDIYLKDIVMYNKSTRTKNDEPLNYFECEPFVCIPGACDPYKCLDRINRRHLKEIGSITEPLKQVSVSNSTYPKKSMKAIQIQSKPQSTDRKILKKTRNIKQVKEYIPSGNTNQTVKIGSSFSFGVEFSKTNTSVNKINFKPRIEQKTKISRKRRDSKLNVANVTTQAKHHKSSMADHIIKRCFCTLNLQKHRKIQNERHANFPREYMVNRVTTRLNQNLSRQRNLNDSNIHLVEKSNTKCSYSHNTHEHCIANRLQLTKCQESLTVVEEKSQCYSLTHTADDDTWESSISFIEERLMSLEESQVTNLTQYARQCFCTMNLQLLNKNLSSKNPKSTMRSGTGKRIKEFSKGDTSAVKLGSNFNFNVEFSKNLSLPKYFPKTESKPKKEKTIGTKSHYNTNFDKQLQSTANKLNDKGSGALPVAKRCFCTLKLQKMGRTNMRNHQNQTRVPDIKIPKTPNNTISRGQNANIKPPKIAYSLQPYECEPNICIPGQCDPYQCLEIMKRNKLQKHTKESGIGTIQTTKSASSITMDNHSKGTQKSHQINIKAKENSVNVSRSTFNSNVIPPSRQVVRVGSNFSFNIEFFKNHASPIETQNKSRDFKDKKQVNRIKNIPKHKEKRLSTPNESKLHKDTEIEKSPNRIASTMTSSFIKRCFCTAQLRKNSSPKFLKKYFSLMKTKKRNEIENIHINKVPQIDKKINTDHVKFAHTEYKLQPYECEPGICVPGECDPYECEKILKRKKMRTKSTLSSTAEFKDSSSVSSNTQEHKMKNEQIQMKKRENVKAIKTHSLTHSPLKHSDRQAVRIGSNFSFNIEFYKNKPSTHPVKLRSKRRKHVNRKSLKNAQSNVISTHSKRSQVESISQIERGTQQKHFLKRCFCTLQLQNEYSHVPERKKQEKKNEDVKLNTKSVMTKRPKHHLIPDDYECPPDICIPNQCDPYECLRIIQMRREQMEYKEFGMSTKSPKKSTVSSTTPSMKKYKQRTQTIDTKKYNKNTNYNTKIKKLDSRVKISSSFEFNIEFFKNRTNQGFEINKQPKPTQIKVQERAQGNVSSAKTQMQKQVKFAKTGNKKTKTQSTAVNSSPKLKRCFCTLFMKSDKEKPIKNIKNTSNIGTETPKQYETNIRENTLLPYECEPQTCIPGECDPVICLERIKRRNKNFAVNTNILQTKSTAGTMTPGKSKFKTKRNQIKSISKGEVRDKNKANIKKQAVRIGSNFNFNIEFYKDNRGSYKHENETHYEIRTPNIKGDQTKKTTHNIKSQLRRKSCDESTCSDLNVLKEKQTYVNNSPTFLKRCFCVLKLNKLKNRKKHAATSFDKEIKIPQKLPPPQSKNIAIQQKLLPYECEPNFCIPGQCDPYECQKRIMARELCNRNKCDKKCYMTQKSHNICAQKNNPCFDKCMGIQAAENKITKNQSSLASSGKTKGIVNEPVHATNFNKQAVRIGSNFSFNIEFFKKGVAAVAPTTLEHIEPKTVEKAHNKNIITKSTFIHNRGSQAKAQATADKAFDAQNELKRCFCTLALQKNVASKNRKKDNALSKPLPYPQNFEVRRVTVEPMFKIPINKNNKFMKSVSTRTNEKYMKENLYVCPCKDATNTTEMQTILPYKSKKFKNASSKTYFPLQSEINRRSDNNEGFRLSKKKNKRYFNYNKKSVKKNESNIGAISNIKHFFCRCAAAFSRRQKNETEINTKNNTRVYDNNNNTDNEDPILLCEKECYGNLRSSKSDRRPSRQFVNVNTKVRKSKSLKLDSKNNEKRIIKENNKIKKSSKHGKIDSTSINLSKKQGKNIDGILCPHCLTKLQKKKSSLPPLKVHFDDKPTKLKSVGEANTLKTPLKFLGKRNEKTEQKNNRKESENLTSCNSCGRRFNKEELQKAAGDRSVNESLKNLKHPHRIRDTGKLKIIDNKVQNESPLFEMQLNSDDYDIINKDEVFDNVIKLSKKSVNDKIKPTKAHKKSCQCCICLGKKYKTDVNKNLKKPCTCGSYVCSKKIEGMKKDLSKIKHRKHFKPCVCGSPICDRESEAMIAASSNSDEVTCICDVEKRKRQQKENKIIAKREAIRRSIVMKKRNEEDRLRKKFRARQDKEMERKINKKSSDYILAAESIIDIGKLGITACTDILRSIARTTSDPKQAYFTLKSMKQDPDLILRTMKSVIQDSGVVATAKRVRLRCMAMRGIRKLKNFLEQYAITNFLLHIADSDPKSRILKKKMAPRLRERLDFNCSLYMGSLRKRPYLCVYDRCPWFYPHFLALLNVWKQFVDIMLFLLAVVVWSPCILCMEACRAITCCFFCTG